MRALVRGGQPINSLAASVPPGLVLRSAAEPLHIPVEAPLAQLLEEKIVGCLEERQVCRLCSLYCLVK